MSRDTARMKAAQDIAEALSLGPPMGAPPPQPMGAPPPALGPQPPAPAGPQGQPSMGALGGGMPQQRPAMSPLQAMPSFKSPPMAAALQAAEGMKGHPAMNRPTGFAEGGFVVKLRR